MNFPVVFITLSLFLVIHVSGRPGGHEMKDPMEGGPMNETMPMNMTGGELMHPGKDDMEAIDSKERGEKRDRRGAVDDMKAAGEDAVKKVESAGKDALQTAEDIGKQGAAAVEKAGNTVATEAKNAWKKAGDAM